MLLPLPNFEAPEATVTTQPAPNSLTTLHDALRMSRQVWQ